MYRDRFAFLVVVALVAQGCGGVTKTDCNDGIDNDGDGLIDNGDPGCDFNHGNVEAPEPPKCVDGIDNDGDTLVDLADPGCQEAGAVDETDPVRACNNGLDDDSDGRTDFPTDTGCESGVDNDEFNPALCNNGMDDDGDGKIDFPIEPGCATLDDDDETDPPVPAQCANGLDDDGDGSMDYPMDMGCSAAGDNDEFNVVPGECGPGVPVVDITGVWTAQGTLAMPRPSAIESPLCTGLGGESVFKFTLTEGGALDISTDFPETTLDTVLYLRGDCTESASELGCDDDGGEVGSGKASHLIIDAITPGTYHLVLDSFAQSSIGNYKLVVALKVGEGDACNAAGPPCVGDLICREVTPGAGTVCAKHVCTDAVDNDGDGKVDFPDEPGCLTPFDDDEVDPVPGPACGDGMDNDLDTFTDYPADDSCLFAAYDNEACTTIGTDAVGYSLCQQSLPALPPCEDVSATGTVVCASDDCGSTITLPFPFVWYGQTFNTMQIAANGQLGFPGVTSFSNTCTIVDNTIAVFWDDLDPNIGGGTFKYQVFGTAPNRHLTVQWKISHHSTGTELIDMRAVIYETTNLVDICYVDTSFGNVGSDLGASATVGIKGPAGVNGVQLSCNMPTVQPGTYLRVSGP